MARKKIKSYFSNEQEDAVKEYLTTTNNVKKNKIFNEILLPAFTIMIESIIRRYNLYIPNEEFDDTFNDTISFLMGKIEHFNPLKVSKKTGKSSKAFSYCGTICKNYLLHKRIEYAKELEKTLSYDIIHDELVDNIHYSTYINETTPLLTEVINKSIFMIKDIMNGNTKGVLTEKEKLVGEALINLLENWEDILINNGSNKFNKSAILYYLREATLLTTKEVRDSMKKYKKAYFILKENIIKNQ